MYRKHAIKSDFSPDFIVVVLQYFLVQNIFLESVCKKIAASRRPLIGAFGSGGRALRAQGASRHPHHPTSLFFRFHTLRFYVLFFLHAVQKKYRVMQDPQSNPTRLIIKEKPARW